MPYTHAIVLDFEATCEDQVKMRPQEVIEFPSVLVQLDPWQIVDEFESFVRPIHHPHLSRFCTDLTSIRQEQVDNAPPFPNVLDAYLRWLGEHNITPENGLVVTCGDWDLRTLLPIQLAATQPPIAEPPAIFRRWLNIKKLYSDVTGRRARGMAGMLRSLELPLIGHHHRGIDDCRNIARLLETLLHKGATFAPTSK